MTPIRTETLPLHDRFQGEGAAIERLHPLSDLKIKDLDFVDLVRKRDDLALTVNNYDCVEWVDLRAHYVLYSERHRMEEQVG